MTKLEKNLQVSKQQAKVDSLRVIAEASIRLHADNRDMLQSDLKRAEEKLEELKA